ncbi:selenocysteine-specific translation elongation factor [Occallatibacter savannae]|uniref:selenocysteine-specific translation elongation factor n=1 Tax=Occallatibacter savannae TaxID=1002691 RepID=UPI000D6992B1|nr:selenocysteine-specific translation elongation factor [Occallatibacter savannae]
MKSLKSIVIGTAGHIDHGKTALVRALTGVDTDRLPEEKRRGITIDLGFASLDAMGQDGSSPRISFVDVPGHALFIRNMLAGAGCVPAVMLVIAADEGVMPQTREHLAICELLGMTDGFTVISKADLVSEDRLLQVRSEVAEFLKGTFLSGAEKPIVAASAKSGLGIAEVRAELARVAARAKAAESSRPMRLPIDRVFVKKGFGTVVTGTLLSGEIRVGQSLVLEPGARAVRVRGLQTHGAAEDVAEAGSRTAVNLSGVDVADVSRGQVLVAAGELAATEVIDAEITLLEDAPALRNRARVHLHAFTSEVMASVSLYSAEPVKPGTKRLARLKLSEPVVLVPGDRFVLRQPLPAGTVGGGRVLDARPLRSAKRAETQKWLEQVAQAATARQLTLRLQRRGAEAIGIEELAREIGLRSDAVREMAEALVAAGELVILVNGSMISAAAFSIASDAVMSRLKSAGSGLKRSVLQNQSGLSVEVFDAVLARVLDQGKAQSNGEVVTIAGAAPAVSAKEAQKLHAVAAAYRKAGIAAPSVKEIGDQLRIGEAELRRLITLLIREKTLVRMGSDDVFVHAEALRELTTKLGAMRGKTMDVAAFKTMTGLTRKHAIPLLELLDRERITRKQGDVRVVL